MSRKRWTHSALMAGGIAPPPSGGGGGSAPFDGALFGTWGNHQVIDWWEWSHDPSNGDPFGIAARASGGGTYWCDPNTGGGSGTQGSPWSPSQLKGQLDNRSLPAGSIVHMLPGEYNNKGLFGGNNQLSGGGQGGGFVTLLGPSLSVGDTARVTCTTDTRSISMRQQSSDIQFVRIRTHNTGMNAAYANYVNGGGGEASSDNDMRGRIGNHNPAGIGFQMDGWGTAAKPGPAIYVNCEARGWGEGFGSFEAGNAYCIGCVGYESAWASPVGRSNFSFSWNNGGFSQTANGKNAMQSPTLGHSYFGGAFACLSFHAFQLHSSRGIGHGDKITDGNGLILPTDGFNSPDGRFFQQANVVYGISGAGVTGFEGAVDGMEVVNNTVFQCGYNSAHSQGINPFNVPIRLVQGKTGGGPAILEQRYIGGSFTPRVSNNVAIRGNYDSRALTVFNDVNPSGIGNVYDGSWDGRVNGTGGGGSIIVGNDPYLASANAHLASNSPAIGAGRLSEAVFPFDFMGRRLIDRGGGSCDAGAIQA